MFNVARELRRYHRDEVILDQNERREIRRRCMINRRRLVSGLRYYDYPKPKQFKTQGSFAMGTMIYRTGRDYDIDDGVYFNYSDVVGRRGAEIPPLEVRNWVVNALYDERFNDTPELLKNCVRVYYKEGYSIDIPVYRIRRTSKYLGSLNEYYELASSTWKVSNPEGVTQWFEHQNKKLSPQPYDVDQMRRVCTLMKSFAKSRDAWAERIATGFMITMLVTECYVPQQSRDDVALFLTMNNISQRLNENLQISHPVLTNEFITNGSNDARVVFFADKVDTGLKHFRKLLNPHCTKNYAMEALDSLFYTEYFTC